MNFIDSLFLFAIMSALAAIPSTSVALVVSRSATLGLENGIAVAAGIVTGDLIFVLLAVLGLSVLAETLDGLFHLIRFLAGVYLIWLGVQLFRSTNRAGIAHEQAHKEAHEQGHGRGHKTRKLLASYLAGLLLTLGDVKAILFYVSLFPAYIDTGQLAPLDIGIIILITLTAVGGVKITWAVAASRLASLPRCLACANVLKKLAASFMIMAGCFLITKG